MILTALDLTYLFSSCGDTHITMATYKIDDLVRDVATQMANSQLTRRSSGHSHRTSTNLRRNAARVMKTNSAESSPRNIGRRRTVMSQAPVRHRSTLDDHYDNMLSFGGQQPIAQSRPQQPTRPKSWHPSSLAKVHRYGQTEAVPSNQFGDSKTTQAAADDGCVPGSINSMMYLPTTTDSTPSLRGPHLPHQMTMSNMGHGYAYATGTEIYPYGLPGMSDPSGDSVFEMHPGFYNTQDSSPVPFYHNWSGGPANVAFDVTTPSTPDFLPIQHPPAVNSNQQGGSQLTKRSSKELVGMGLYDDPDSSTSFSTVGEPLQYFLRSQFETYPTYQAPGKGLKLEETWQPPSEEGMDQADENYSSDGSEDQPPRASVRGAPQQVALPSAPDRSNHTFYFENEDTYDGRVFLNETMSAIEAKVPGAGFDAFAWA